MASCSITIMNTLAGVVSSNKKGRKKNGENTTGHGHLMTMFTTLYLISNALLPNAVFYEMRSSTFFPLSKFIVTYKEMNSSYATQTYTEIKANINKRKQIYHLDSPP